MGRPCTVCAHPQRLEIDRALLDGNSFRGVAGRYGLQRSSVDRHRAHIAKSMKEADALRKETQLVRSSTLLEDVRANESRAVLWCSYIENILRRAIEGENDNMAIKAMKTGVTIMAELRGYMELRGELTNELGRNKTAEAVAVQIIIPGPDRPPMVMYGAPQRQLDAPGVVIDVTADTPQRDEITIGLPRR